MLTTRCVFPLVSPLRHSWLRLREYSQSSPVSSHLRSVERLRRTSGHLENSINTYEEQIEIAFEAQNDDLARTFIRKKLETEHRLQTTVRAIADMAAETEAQQHRLREQPAHLDAIIANMPLYAGEQSHTEPSVGSTAPSGVAEEDVEAAFLRAKRQRAGGEH